MSIQLVARGRPSTGLTTTILGRVSFEPVSGSGRERTIRALAGPGQEESLAGYAGALIPKAGEPQASSVNVAAIPTVTELASLAHLATGDVVALDPSGRVRTLFRFQSSYNTILVTERCNSLCVMCSQPPRDDPDEIRTAENLRLIELIDSSAREIGITGGEPTLLKADFLRLVEKCRDFLPATSLHVLSNGRLFYYGRFAGDLASIGHPDLMIGVPLYSDLDRGHDFVVQAAGAFDETMVGLHNLARHGVSVEIRVVLHRWTYERLPALADYIYRNLPFAAHVALMGLEPMGFGAANFKELWIDPFDYRGQLEEATLNLAARGMAVSIYNHQLCVLPRSLWPFSRKSISDWKNDYLPGCEGCLERQQCGGFFTSSILRGYSSHIRPFAPEEGVTAGVQAPNRATS